jgi:hypothetical protein
MATLSPIAPSWTPLRPCPLLMGMITLAPLVIVYFAVLCVMLCVITTTITTADHDVNVP